MTQTSATAADAPTVARASVHDTELAYRRGGAGPPVLYLHGHWAPGAWTPFHAALAEQVDLLAPQAPGFGDSPCPAWVTGRLDVALLYRDLLDTLGLERVHLAGYGLGAWLAADFAVLNPHRTASLTVLAPFGIRVPDHPIADVFILNPADYADTYYNGALPDDPELVPGPGSPEWGGAEAFARRYGDMGGAARLMWDRRYDPKLDHLLPRLRLPALVVAAEHDRVVPAEHPARWAELLGAHLETIPGAGHALTVQQPEQAAAAVAGFVHAAHARKETPGG